LGGIGNGFGGSGLGGIGVVAMLNNAMDYQAVP
jgi:hypothetical protein